MLDLTWTWMKLDDELFRYLSKERLENLTSNLAKKKNVDTSLLTRIRSLSMRGEKQLSKPRNTSPVLTASSTIETEEKVPTKKERSRSLSRKGSVQLSPKNKVNESASENSESETNKINSMNSSATPTNSPNVSMENIQIIFQRCPKLQSMLLEQEGNADLVERTMLNLSSSTKLQSILGNEVVSFFLFTREVGGTRGKGR
eukprot:TRINITY_DN22452_c0_g1_i1.p1 TRINITY_DN22452_c0_g1~~TRINITY_DN22452_c0_g1_i1.p1  ORF type:complete len:201 (-),score=46.92 TRINITY_DN22452_c0_g1_i1:187-789(-)